MSFLALSLSRKISYAKNFVLLPPEIPGGRYNLLLIAVNQIFYHRFIGLLLKLHDLLLCHISRTGFILVGGAILLTGIVCTVVLNEIDAQCHLSEKLKYAIRDGLKRQQELDKWKRGNMTPFMYVLNTPPVI